MRYPMRSSIIIGVCLLFALNVWAIDITGSLSGSIGPGDYTVVGNIYVANGNSLNISPGATFLFNSGYNFTIAGYLNAVGTSADSIKFILNTGASSWSGIRFEPTASDNSILEYCLISGAAGNVSGGGFYADSCNLTLRHSTIANNSSTNTGGGITLFYSNAVMEYCDIIGNQTGYDGGGLFTDHSNAQISHCTFSDNYADDDGGGICFIFSDPDITECDIIDNSCNDEGGGIIIMHLSDGIISNCTITGNDAHPERGDGGGIYVYNYSHPLIFGNTILNNTAGFLGGGIASNLYSNPIIGYNLIAGNVVLEEDGGGIGTAQGATPTIWNNTIANNSAFDLGDGFYCDNVNPILINNIIWGDDNNQFSAINGAVPAVTYNNIRGGWTGLGNIDEDPLFVGSGDYHLIPGSRSIDAGSPDSLFNNEPEPNGDRQNQGCYGNTTGATVSQVTFDDMTRDEYVMIGIPVEVPDGDPITLFHDNVDYATPGWPWWRVSRWNIENGTYVRYQEPDWPVNIGLDPPPFEPGLGFWFVQDVLDVCVLDIIEEQMYGAISQDDYLAVALDPPANGNHGMNMLANPYPYIYDWRQTRIFDGSDTLSISDAADSAWVSGYAYLWDWENCQYQPVEYVGGGGGGGLDYSVPSEYAIPVWSGILVEQLDDSKDLEVLFEPRWMHYGVAPDGDLDDVNWHLQLCAQTDDGIFKNEHSRIGAGTSCSDGYDAMDAIAYVPYSDSFVMMYFTHQEWGMTVENFTYDYRSHNFSSPKEYSFTVWAYNLPGETLILTWPNISEISDDYDFRLDNTTSGGGVEDLRTTNEYTFTVGGSGSEAVNFCITVSYSGASVGDNDESVPQRYGLVVAYPNPFNAEIQVKFNLPLEQDVSLKVYNLLGRMTAVLAQGKYSSGLHETVWNASNQASGIYFLRLEYGENVSTDKVLLIK